MNPTLNAVANRLSLRPPQRRALEILGRLVELSEPTKGTDLAAVLPGLRSEFPSLTEFEHEFVSVCFALATGVGKTRLMGAFITYLALTRRSRHFFVLAPNLTIYDKLIADFTPGTPKYVFQGIAEFVTAPPVVVTGENYEAGFGVRAEIGSGLLPLHGSFDAAIHVNVFNISKINSDVRSSQRGGKPPRIKRLAEYLGESYFDYLAALPDLVLLMDESHRYRADAGTKAINDLKPILGLELTATPFIESARGPVPFKNVVYSYPLAQAIADGFVKEPAVATRKNFDASSLSPEQLEQIKIEDAIRLHEQVKTDLRIYADQNDKAIVKPFMLVIARDTEHANRLIEAFKLPTFFEGRYADKVIQVHSALTGDERDETVQHLLAVESPNEPTEIVIHVNMLKEGWDVNNLYTIVPLRAANARTLIEQSIGRGLRLPYGKRVGIPAVDRLTIVAHDKFQEIVDEARRGDSIIKNLQTIVLDSSGAPEPKQVVEVAPIISEILAGKVPFVSSSETTTIKGDGDPAIMFQKPAEQALARAILAAIHAQAGVHSSIDLRTPENQVKLLAAATSQRAPQPGIPYDEIKDPKWIVAEITEQHINHTIDIPRITVVPTDEVAAGFEPFDLDCAGLELQPVAEDILVQHLQSNRQEQLSVTDLGDIEERLENYVVRALIDFTDIDYDSTAALLYRLAEQVIAHLRSYLKVDNQVRNVLLYHQLRIGKFVYTQLQRHRYERTANFEAKVTKGFTPLRGATYTIAPGEAPRDFRAPVDERRRIDQMLFCGFKKCLYRLQRFQSDPERRFCVVLENDGAVLKWVKPAKGTIAIMLRGGVQYEPDFVVETAKARFLCEVKRSDQFEEEGVVERARAATTWCWHATNHTKTTDGKPWGYALIRDTAIQENKSFDGLMAEFERRSGDLKL